MIRIFIIAFCAILITSCSFLGQEPNHEFTLDFDPHESLRIAVLPFAINPEIAAQKEGANIKREKIPPTKNLILDHLSSSETLNDVTTYPTRYLRRLVEDELLKTNLSVISPAIVEIELAHNGYQNQNGEFITDKIHESSPQELCKILTCDVILRGEIKDLSRSYYGVESVSRVELGITILSARSGKTIFTSVAKDTHRAGLTGGPTGLSSLVLEPLSGLDPSIIKDLSQNVATSVVKPLVVTDTDYAESPPLIYTIATKRLSSNTLILMYGSSGKTGLVRDLTTSATYPLVEANGGRYHAMIPAQIKHTANSRSPRFEIELIDERGRKTQDKV